MTIRRVGPLPDADPTRRSLGRVLVTIDDLDALIAILREETIDPKSVRVQFSGGYFTDADDLRQLCNDEILTLKVVSDKAEVDLDPTQAVAIGDEDVTSRVDDVWARRRQTTRGTRIDTLQTVLRFCLALGFLSALLVIAGQRVIAGAGDISETVMNWFVLVIASLGIIAVAGLSVTQTGSARRRPGAVVEAISMHEFRQLQKSNYWPRVAGVTAILSVVIAAIAALAALQMPTS